MIQRRSLLTGFAAALAAPALVRAEGIMPVRMPPPAALTEKQILAWYRYYDSAIEVCRMHRLGILCVVTTRYAEPLRVGHEARPRPREA